MNPKDRKRISQTLSKKHLCYVLITCEEPSEDGNIQVEMTYEGDATLASYILQDAQIKINDQENKRKEGCNSKIYSING
jgi:hypothetical protein